MRLFWCLLLIGAALTATASAFAAPTHKDGCVAALNACSISGTAAASDFAVLGVVTDTTISVSSFTDDKSDSCTVGTPVSSGTKLTPIYCLSLTSGAKTFTATLSGASTVNEIAVDTYSGVVNTTPLDKTAGQHQTTPGTGSNAITSGSAGTASASGELVWAITVNSTGLAGAGTITAGTGFTARQSTANLVRTEDLTQGAAAAVTGTFTAGSASDSFNTIVMSFLTGEQMSKNIGFTVLQNLGPNMSKVVGFAVLQNLGPNMSKVVGFAVLAGSQEALSKDIGFAVLCTPTTGILTGACPIPPPKAGGGAATGIPW